MIEKQVNDGYFRVRAPQELINAFKIALKALSRERGKKVTLSVFFRECMINLVKEYIK